MLFPHISFLSVGYIWIKYLPSPVFFNWRAKCDPEYWATYLMSHSKSHKKETEGSDLFLTPLIWWTPPYLHCAGECLFWPDRYHPWDQKVLRDQAGGREPVLCQLHTYCRIWSLEDRWQTSTPGQAKIWPHHPTPPLPQAYWNSFIIPPKQSTEKQNDKPKLTCPSHSCYLYTQPFPWSGSKACVY